VRGGEGAAAAASQTSAAASHSIASMFIAIYRGTLFRLHFF
jgi:hypothetical protein